MRKLLALAVIGLCGCPSPSGSDGGSAGGSAVGGGSAGGVAAAGGSASAGGSVSPLVTPAAFCSAYTAARCEAEVRCGTLATAQRASCLATRAFQCGVELTKLDAGAWRFDDAAAKGCIDALALQADAGVCSSSTFCDPWRPAGGVGAPCSYLECVDGTACQPNTLGCRTCQPLKRLGEACDAFNSCGFGTFCPFVDPSDGGVRRCQPRLPEGAECGTLFECLDGGVCVPPFDGGVSRCSLPRVGAACGNSVQCAPDQFCKDVVNDFQGQAVTAGSCQPRLALGQPCTNQQEDDGCFEGSCLQGQCQRARFTQAVGAECDDNENCVAGAFCADRANAFPDGGTRVRRGTCRSRVGVDGGCFESIFDSESCQPGLTCLDTFCRPLAREGEGCPPSCQSELVCSTRCIARGQRGSACDVTTSGCAIGLGCVRAPGAMTGVCGDRFANGTPCRNDGECASALCGTLPDAGQACVACR